MALESVTQAADGTLLWWSWAIPVLPAVSAAVLLLLGARMRRAVAAGLALGSVGLSAVLSTAAFVAVQAGGGEAVVRTVARWMPVGDLQVDWTILLDPLSTVMLLLVTWVGLLIHVYSVGYMADDPRFSRFFAYLNLFVASMLVLVMAEGLLTLFVGWELVGLCSYLLIGFWYERPTFASAAKKAFVVNRVGDAGFMIAMFVLLATAGTLSFTELVPGGADALGTGTATAVGLLLLVAAAGKSAQIPLHVWLPDAMAGPTPVSALIHAATMVTAGVYLFARMSPVVLPEVGTAVAWVGAITALVAALVACTQRDLKKILAWSTVSQLGYMFIAVGVGSSVAAVFHLLTHGFFKALLFLVAGSVMHAMDDETDVWRMGGLRRAMPWTFATAVVGWAAISGVPLLSGFFSKEEILAAAADTPGAGAILVIGLVVAGLTAFYMTRWLVLIFLGRPRHADLAPAPHPHESPAPMVAPLVVLAAASALGGLINLPGSQWLAGWLEPSVAPFEPAEPMIGHTLLEVVAVAIAAAGVAAAAALYLRRVDHERLRERLGLLHELPRESFYFDALYERAVAAPGHALARGSATFDRVVIDGAVLGLARGTAGLASLGRRLQTGWLRSYALAIAAGALLLVVVVIARVV